MQLKRNRCRSVWKMMKTIRAEIAGLLFLRCILLRMAQAGTVCRKKGDAVRLYFPTEKRKMPLFQVPSMKIPGGTSDKTRDKTVENKEGKEICLTPEKILITNNYGMSVELSEQQGNQG